MFSVTNTTTKSDLEEERDDKLPRPQVTLREVRARAPVRTEAEPGGRIRKQNQEAEPGSRTRKQTVKQNHQGTLLCF